MGICFAIVMFTQQKAIESWALPSISQLRLAAAVLSFLLWLSLFGWNGWRDKSLCLFVNWRPTPSSPSVPTSFFLPLVEERQFIYTAAALYFFLFPFFFTPRAVWTRFFRHGRVPTAPQSSSTDGETERKQNKTKKSNKFNVVGFWLPPLLWPLCFSHWKT
jgi:hypothetical protein